MYNSINIDFARKIYLILLIFNFGFYNTYIVVPNSIGTISTLIMFLIYVMFFVFGIFKIKDLLMNIFLLLIGVLSYLYTGASAFTLVLLSINVLRELEPRTILRYFITIRGVIIFIVIASALIGLIPNHNMVVVKSGINYVSNYALGFTHPNQLAQALGSFLLSLFVLLFPQRVPIWGGGIFLLLSVAIYLLTSSRIFFLCAIIFSLSILLMQFKQGDKILDFLLKYAPVWIILSITISLGFSFEMTRVSGETQRILYWINGFFSSRFSFGSAVMNNYPVTLFGTTFDFSVLESLFGKYTVDIGYVNLLYGFGLIPFIIYVLLNINFSRKIYSKKYRVLLLNIILFAIWAIFENLITNPAINFPILLWGYFILMPRLFKVQEEVIE